jgi:Tol biopolymer transport system component
MIEAGARLGPYEIVAPLGAGGMGEVWKARDTRLKREVAVKTLPREFAADTARRLRFEAEARAVAALNHPNIVAIYDVGTHDGTPYIVTELVDGEPLAGSGFPLRKILNWAVQIANGLAAAHAAGIVHRDLKPANILLARDGRIRILDFGLAKLSLAPAAEALETQTLQTQPGVVMGTIGYMSPEQVRGKEADPRSDIFSFGLVLYEMLSGRRGFQGETAVEIMTAILKQEPPDLPDSVPRGVRQIVRNCMEKDPADRFQSARDLGFALAALSESPAQSGTARKLAQAPRWRQWTLRAAGALALVALSFTASRFFAPVTQPSNWNGALLGGPEIAFRPRSSPDGHLVAFYAVDGKYTQVGVMTPAGGNWSILTHSQGNGSVTNVTWAPDGATIYYDRWAAVPQGIYSVPVLGGDERLIMPRAFRPEALPDGSLLADKLNANRQWQLFRFWPETGREQDLPVAVVDAQDSLANPRAFPDGREAVVVGAPLGHEAGGMSLLIVDLATGATRRLAPHIFRGAAAIDYVVSRDGKSVLAALQLGEFTRVLSIPARGNGPVRTLFTATHEVWGLDSAPDGSIYASIMDWPAEIVRRAVDKDQPEILARFQEVSDPDIFAVMPDGRVALTVLYSDRARLMAVAPGKNPVPLAATTEETSAPVTAVGSTEVAFLIGREPRSVIAIADLETGRITRRISPGKGEIHSLVASPDGRTLYFATSDTVWSAPSAGGETRRVRAGNRVVAEPSGQAVFISVLESSNMRLFRVPLDGTPETEVQTNAADALRYSHLSSGSLSADGRLLVSLHNTWFSAPAILDTHTGRVQPLPFDGTTDYESMAWLPDGRIVALRHRENSTLWRFTPSPE